MKRRSAQVLAALGVLLVGAIVVDVVRGLTAPPAQPGLPPPVPPAGALEPASTAVKLSGDARRKYLALAPIREGTRFPSLDLVDSRGDTVRLPGKQPVVLAVLCGCRDCAGAGSELAKLGRRMADRSAVVLIVSNTAPFVWERMVQSFGAHALLVRDEQGQHYRRLRPPDNGDPALPMVWGIDARGDVRFFRRPSRSSQGWTADLERRLRLKVVED